MASDTPRSTGRERASNNREVYESNEGGFHVGVRYRPDRYNEESMKFTGEYMLKQHEYSWLEHPNGGKAKFLEDPFRLVAATLSRSIRERIRWSLDNTGEWPGYSEEDNDS